MSLNTGTASTPAIEIDGLTKRFGPHTAVDNLCLTIPAGSTFGFIGPNGAGKTTTIRMLMHMLRPTAGRVRIMGMDVAAGDTRVKDRVGYVPELHFIYRWMRVGEALGFCRSLFSTWNDALCADLLAKFELDPARKVRQLSKGMVAKLALLLAVSHDPDVLILDEPTSGLDPLVREEFLDGVLRTLCVCNRTVLFSSHTLSDVQRIADTVGLIYEGRLVEHCATDELVTQTKRIRAVLRDGCQPATPPAGTVWQQVRGREWLMTVRGFSSAAVEQLRQTGVVDGIDVLDLGLEEVFKDVVKGRRASA